MKPSIERCQGILSRLIQVNTCQPEGNEADIVAVIQDMLPTGVEEIVIEHGNNRASLIVKIHGKEKSGGAAFIGHLDTVAYNDLNLWKYPPTKAVTEKGVLYGRGASDMKGGVAAMIMTIQNIISSKIRPDNTLFFCFTADEENGGIGIRTIVEKGYLNGIASAVICEPSAGKIGICEKGALWLKLHLHGIASHASRPDLGVNAVEYAIAFAKEMQSEANRYGKHKILGGTTVSITRFQGGIMTNIIPSDASMELDIRTAPGVSHEELLEKANKICGQMQSEHEGLQAELQILNNRPALESDRSTGFMEDMFAVAADVGISTEEKGLYFYTDASQLIPYIDIPFVIAGPGDDAMAHRINEAISLESVAGYTAFYSHYVKKVFLKEEEE